MKHTFTTNGERNDRGCGLAAPISSRSTSCSSPNPDLVERLRDDASLNAPRQETFYDAAAEGHTDYPALSDA